MAVIPRPQYSTGADRRHATDLIFTTEGYFGEGEAVPGSGWGIMYDLFYMVPLGDDRFLIVYYYDESEVNPDQTVYEFGQILTITGETYTAGPRFDWPVDCDVRQGIILAGPNQVMYAKPDRFLRPGGNPNLGRDYWEQTTLTLIDIGDTSATVLDEVIVITREDAQRNQSWSEVEIYPGPDEQAFLVYLRATFSDFYAIRRVHVDGNSIIVDPEIVTTGAIIKAGHPVGDKLVFTPVQNSSSTTPMILRIFDGAQMAWVGEIELPTSQTNTSAVALDDHTLFVASSEDYDEARIFSVDITSGTVTEHDNSKWPVRLDALGWKTDPDNPQGPYRDPRREPTEMERGKSFIRNSLQVHLLSPGMIAGISVRSWGNTDDNEKVVWFWDVEKQEVKGWGIVKSPLGFDESEEDLVSYLAVAEAHPLLAKHHEQPYSGGLLISLTENFLPWDYDYTIDSIWMTMASLTPPKVEGEPKGVRRRFWQ